MTDISPELARLLGAMEGKLTTLLEQNAKESRERGEQQNVRFDRLEREMKLTNERLDSTVRGVQKLEGRVADAETAVRKGRDEQHKSAHDLSEFKAEAASKEQAIIQHVKRLEKGQSELSSKFEDATKDQNVELGKQTKSLVRIERLGPVIIAVATAIGAYYSSRAAQPGLNPAPTSIQQPER